MTKPKMHANTTRINPPVRIELETESAVMKAISGFPSPRLLHQRRRRSVVAVSTLVAFSMILLVLFQNPSPKTLVNTDYAENRIYLPNHTSIWLTPIVVQQGGK